MGYHSRALLFISGDEQNVEALAEHIKQRSETKDLFGSQEDQYKLIADHLEIGESLDEDLWAVRAEIGWFKAYSEWSSVIQNLYEYCEKNALEFNYCRIGEEDSDTETISSIEDEDMVICIERGFKQDAFVHRCFAYE